MEKIIITSGKKYIDTDGLACTLALRDLLALEGKKSEAVLVGEITYSITDSIKRLGFDFLSEFANEENANLILVDASEPDQLPKFVDVEKVIEVYDHHFGFEKFWQDKIGEKAKIEPVGACATLIWEEYKKRGMEDKISSKNAKLLMMAIVSNTLNFNASITSQRDRSAFDELKEYISFSEDQIREYFLEQEKSIDDDVKKAINNDTKVQIIANINRTLVIGQVELWEGKNFVEKYSKEIREVLSSYGNSDYFMNVPSISEGKNYIYTKSDMIKKLLSKNIDAKFENNTGTTSRLWLRKEILKELYQAVK